MTSHVPADAVGVRQRFLRSANVEHDDLARAVTDYVPTGRSLDVLGRVARAMQHPATGRAISITGPYGSGKSSLALFLEALLGPGTDATTVESLAVIREVAPGLAKELEAGRTAIGADARGFVCGVATARLEPIEHTITRALERGLVDYIKQFPKEPTAPPLKSVLRELRRKTSQSDVADLVLRVAAVAPVLILIDEFGKNLEHFASDGSDARGDLFVLQELAERGSRPDGLPVMLVTLQHLAFDEYVGGASDTQRREFSKIQGRFHDIAYLETPAESQTLISAVFEPSEHAKSRIASWADSMAAAVAAAALEPAIHIPVRSCYPLHPVAVAVLPELCSRYAQNERTLFSFLAGSEPSAVPALLRRSATPAKDRLLPSVGVAEIYDFFVDAASSAIGASPGASRWLEVETRIRDSRGLSDAELRVLKTIGALNLVSAGGAVRASRSIVSFCLLGEGREELSESDVETVLERLENKGLITYREFADEFRLWHGSDFDLRGELESGQRRSENEPLAELLQRIRPLHPVVAGRHSQKTGTMRFFERKYVDRASAPVSPPDILDSSDGLVVLSLEASDWRPSVVHAEGSVKPILLGVSHELGELELVARKHAAHVLALEEASARDDWVAQRELRERLAGTANMLDHALEQAFSAPKAEPMWLRLPSEAQLTVKGSLSAMLSDVCDEVYDASPPLRNEMLARDALTSQGARARADLLAQMVANEGADALSIVGYGPDRAMYEATLRASGIHRFRAGEWAFGAPKRGSGYEPVWRAINKALDGSARRMLAISDLHGQLAAPPFGLKRGPVPVLVLAALLARADEIGLYEEGTFVPSLALDVGERLIKNPDRFTVRNYALRGPRSAVLLALADALKVELRHRSDRRVSTAIGVVGPLLRTVRQLPPYALRTRKLSEPTVAVRSALLSAREPDELLFADLPEAVGLEPISATNDTSVKAAKQFATKLLSALRELDLAYSSLLDELEVSLAEQLGTPVASVHGDLRVRAGRLTDQILDPGLKAFANALANREADRDAWLEQIGMVLARTAPSSWTDDDRASALQTLVHQGLSFRRVENLHFSQSQIAGEAFNAVRVSVTLSDGRDMSRVVWADETARSELEELLEETLRMSAARLGSRGPEMLLAELAQRTLLTDRVSNSAPTPLDERIGESANG